jgi:hypothetical protein
VAPIEQVQTENDRLAACSGEHQPASVMTAISESKYKDFNEASHMMPAS